MIIQARDKQTNQQDYLGQACDVVKFKNNEATHKNYCHLQGTESSDFSLISDFLTEG